MFSLSLSLFIYAYVYGFTSIWLSLELPWRVNTFMLYMYLYEDICTWHHVRDPGSTDKMGPANQDLNKGF